MAASFPTLDQMTGSRPGENPLDHPLMDTSETFSSFRAAQAVYELATRENPQEAVDLSHEGSPPVASNSMTQRWSDHASGAHTDTSRLHCSQNLPVAEHHTGFVLEGYERVQSFRGEELRFGVSETTISRHENQQNAGNSSHVNNQQRVFLTFPEGEVDAVKIIERDMEGQQPTKFLSNNIIDFYIKYLERRLPSEARNRLYFFNSFFFTKLLGNNSASIDIDRCKIDYEQVRKWTAEVNLFDKDYIFIPVLRSLHWSLIIICHLSSLSGEWNNPPFMLHLDAGEGKHESFEGQVQSYILQEWTETYQASKNMYQLLALRQMKYAQAKAPQQDTGYDCGLYLVHYVEVFLRESDLQDFSFASSKGVHILPVRVL